MRSTALLSLGFIALWLAQARGALAAEPSVDGVESASESSRVALAFGPTLAVAEKCSRDSDVVWCEPGRAFLGIAFSALFPLIPELSLGPFVNAGFDPGTASDQSGQFGAAGAELRVLPYAPSSFWLGARAGVYTVRDVTSVEDGSDVGEHVSRAWAPSVGGGLGFDTELGDSVGLSFAWSLDYVMLTSDGALPEDHGVDWSPGLWLAFGLGMYWTL